MLNVKKINSAKPKEKSYKLSDSEGLYLFISTAGGKSWRLDYTFNHNRKTLTLGKYPIMTLAEVREEKDIAKKMLAQGKDPGVERKQSALLSNVSKANTFKAVADEWHRSKLASWSDNYAEDIKGWLENEIFPYIISAPFHFFCLIYLFMIKPVNLLFYDF